MNREFRYWGESIHDTDSETDSESAEDNPVIVLGIRGPNAPSSSQIRKISTEIQCGINRIREENPESCDIGLIVGKYKILAHKLILSSCSPYFNAMFTKSFTEKDRKEVKLEGLDDDAIKILIDYMYTGHLPLDVESVQRIVLMARFLQIDSAEELCARYIINKIKVDTCLRLLLWAGNNSVKRLLDVLIKYVATNFSQLYLKPEFLLIEIDEFKKLLAEKQVRHFPVDIIFTVIVRWISSDLEARLQYLYDLLNPINSSHVTEDLLFSSTLGQLLPKHILNNWISRHLPIDLSILTNWDLIICKRTGHFHPRLYKPLAEATIEIKSIPKDYFDGSYVNYGGSVYHLGGCLTKRPVSNETFCYNIYKNKWSSFIPMKRSRAYHSSCILNGKLYTCGGSDGQMAFKSTECIDLVSGEQMLLPDMIYPRESLGLTKYANAIYAIGGRNRGICQYYTCERYDPRVGQWELLTTTSYLPGVLSCAIVGDSIYCTNGKADGMDRFDVAKNEWTKIFTQYKRFPCEVFEMKNELYGVFKDHVALYEVMTGKWKIVNQFGYHHDNLVALPVCVAPHDNIIKMDI